MRLHHAGAQIWRHTKGSCRQVENNQKGERAQRGGREQSRRGQGGSARNGVRRSNQLNPLYDMLAGLVCCACTILLAIDLVTIADACFLHAHHTYLRHHGVYCLFIECYLPTVFVFMLPACHLCPLCHQFESRMVYTLRAHSRILDIRG